MSSLSGFRRRSTSSQPRNSMKARVALAVGITIGVAATLSTLTLIPRAALRVARTAALFRPSPTFSTVLIHKDQMLVISGPQGTAVIELTGFGSYQASLAVLYVDGAHVDMHVAPADGFDSFPLSRQVAVR